MCQPQRQSALGPVVGMLLLIGFVGWATGAGAEELPKPKVPKRHHAPEQPRPSGKGRVGEVARVAYDAGFRGKGLTTAVAVALAESGGRARARNPNGPTRGCPRGSMDRGTWQINSCYHGEVSTRCADSPPCAARAAYRISNRGRSWVQWTTYTHGSYRRHMEAARRAVGRL